MTQRIQFDPASSKKIIIVQITVFVLLLMPFIYKYQSVFPLFIFVIIFYLWRFVPIRLVCRDMMTANKKMMKGNFKDIIPLYEKSYDFFNKHLWINKYKAILFLSPLSISLQELCLINIAYTYVQLGQKEKGKEEYQKILELYPENYIAINAMKFLQ